MLWEDNGRGDDFNWGDEKGFLEHLALGLSSEERMGF